MRTLSARERKLIAIAILLAASVMLWFAAIAPVLRGFTDRVEQRAQLRSDYQRNTRLINAIPALRRRVEKQKSVQAQFVLTAPTATLARDKLRERLRRDFAAAGGEVSAVQDLPAQPGQVSAWVQGRMTLQRLQQLLVSINDTPPYLITESLRVSADRALETGHLDIMDIRLEVSIPISPAA
jgi:hypothetical protein